MVYRIVNKMLENVQIIERKTKITKETKNRTFRMIYWKIYGGDYVITDYNVMDYVMDY